MSITASSLKKLSKRNNNAVLDRVLRRSQVQAEVPFVVEDVVPPGKYVTAITSVHEAKTEKGKDAVDIVYTFTDADGCAFQARERYPLEGYWFEKFVDHLFMTGLLSEDATISQLVGIEEQVEVVYSRKGSLGRLLNRKPCKGGSSKAGKVRITDGGVDEQETVDDEYDDFLDEDD